MSPIATSDIATDDSIIPDVELLSSLDDHTRRLKRDIKSISKELSQLKKQRSYLDSVIRDYDQEISEEDLRREITKLATEVKSLCETCDSYKENCEYIKATKIAMDIQKKMITLARCLTRLRQHRDKTYIPHIQLRRDVLDRTIIGREARLADLKQQLRAAKECLGDALTDYTTEVFDIVDAVS